MAPTLDTLIPQFHSEAIEEWVRASRAIGALGQAALPLLRRHLADTDDIHARRHAWCVLTSYLEATEGQGEEPTLSMLVGPGGKKAVERPARRFVQDVLVGAILDGHRSSGRPFGDFVELPGIAELRVGAIAVLEAKRDKTRTRLGHAPNERAKKGIEAAIAKAEEAIAAWQDDATPMADLQGIPAQPTIQDWCFASLVAGLRVPLLDALGIPIDLLASGLAALAAPGGDRLAYVKNLPRMFLEPSSAREREARAPLIPDLLHALTEQLPGPLKSPVHWVEYVMILRELAAGYGLEIELPEGRGLAQVEPVALRERYQAWMASPDEAAALALLRACEACFADGLRWAEMTPAERLVLPIFHMAAVAPTSGKKRKQRLGLGHRIDLLRQYILHWQDENPEILAVLVRTWKLLLHEQLTKAPRGPEALGILLDHIVWIEPLVASWNLRSIVLKDLATIAARALCACHEACHPREDPPGTCRFNELLYTILHALPELQLLREMTLYSAPVPEVAALLSHIVAVLTTAEPQEQGDRWRAFLEAAWASSESDPAVELGAPSQADVAELIDVLGNPGAQAPAGRDEAVDWRRALAWMVALRVRVGIGQATAAGGAVNQVFRDELESRQRDEVGDAVAEVARLVEEIHHLEASLRDPGFEVDAVGSLRDLIERVRDLERSCRIHLPVVERNLVVDSLRALRIKHESRYAFLSSVLEGEHEVRALAAIGVKDPDWSEHQPAAGDYRVHEEDERLLVRWMVGRQMLRELSGRSRILRLLTSARGVALWIGVPYGLCVILNLVDRFLPQQDLAWLAGLPFALAPLAGLLLLAAYLLPRKGGFERKDRASMLIPHMVGALFLGIMERFAADENWSLAFESNPIIRFANIAIFLVAAVFFVRFVMLRTQSPQPRPNERTGVVIETGTVLRRRTRSLLAIGFWLSFLFITIYSMLMGGVMAGESRAAIATMAPETLGSLATLADLLIPNAIQVPLIPGHLTVPIFPWAILTWTVQLFFFSAIFERIMNREG
jgi:hypothetical protein